MSRLRSVSGPGTAWNLDGRQVDPVLVSGADLAVLAAFWSAALGYGPDPGGEPDVIVDPAGGGPRLRFQLAGPAATDSGPPRLELEVTGSGPFVRHRALVEAEVARLVALGATVVGRAQTEERDRYGVVLTDPAGNEFTVG